MTKRAKWLLSTWMIIFVGIQFFGPVRTNPTVVKSHTVQHDVQLPLEIVDLLSRACMDCHSYETRWPRYSGVAPVRWWLVNHVERGRDQLNFSEWTQYQPSFAAATIGSLGEVVKRKLMPLESYEMLHPRARLSDAEVRVFCDWAEAERSRIIKALWDKGKAEKGN